MGNLGIFNAGACCQDEYFEGRGFVYVGVGGMQCSVVPFEFGSAHSNLGSIPSMLICLAGHASATGLHKLYYRKIRFIIIQLTQGIQFEKLLN